MEIPYRGPERVFSAGSEDVTCAGIPDFGGRQARADDAGHDVVNVTPETTPNGKRRLRR